MLKSCKILNIEGAVSVFNSDGSSSSLYKEALKYTDGDVDSAVKLWSVTQTNLWGDQMDNKEDNVSLDEVLRFIDNLPLLEESLPKLTVREIQGVRDVMKQLDLQEVSQLATKMNNLFQPNGYFEINSDRLMRSGIYTFEDIETINPKNMRDFIARLNIHSIVDNFSIPSYGVGEGKIRFKDLTRNKNVIGTHPFITLDDISQTIAEITDDFSKRGIENALLDSDFADVANNKSFVNRIFKYLSTKQKVDKFFPTADSQTESIVNNTLLENLNTSELEESLDFLTDILPEVWEDSQKNIKKVVKDVVDITTSYNVDIIGLEAITQDKQAVIDIVSSTIQMLNNPSTENIKNFSQIKDSYIRPQSNTILKQIPSDKYRGLTIRSVSTNQTQDELFENNSLIKIGEELYQQIDRTNTTKEDLYNELYNRVIDGNIIVDRKYLNNPDLNLKDPLYESQVMEALSRWINSRNIGVNAPINGEEISLYQVLFNHPPMIVSESYSELSGKFSEEYLKTSFVSDFYQHILNEKRDNSDEYNNVLKYFSIGDGDIYFNSPSIIDITGTRYEEELREYAKLKKDGQIKEFAPIQDYINEDVMILNNPELASEIEGGDYVVLDNEWLVTKRNNPNNYLRESGNLYRRVKTDLEGSVYAKVNENASQIYNDLDLNFSFNATQADAKLKEAQKIFSPIKAKEVKVIESQAKIENRVNSATTLGQYSESELNSLVESLGGFDSKKYKNKSEFIKDLGLQGVLDQLMKTNLVKGYEIMDTEQIRNKLIELGVDTNIAFHIVGEKSSYNNSNLVVALEMEDNGKSTQEIKFATGWERGIDGLWRTEVDVININEKYSKQYVFSRMLGKDVYQTSLEDIYPNTELFRLYPDLKNTNVVFYEDTDGVLDSFNMFYNTQDSNIYVNKIVYGDRFNENTTAIFKKDLIHEVQHFIQNNEGFARGANEIALKNRINNAVRFFRKDNSGRYFEGVDDQKFREDFKRIFKNKVGTELDIFLNNSISDDITETILDYFSREMYNLSAGEVEARNVQKRSLMPIERRISSLTELTEDTDRSNQWIQFQKQGITLLPNGFYHNGKVYINKDTATLDTPIHEFAHAYNQLLKNERPEFYNEGLRLVEEQGQEYINFVRENQPNLVGEDLLEEALTQAVGDAGAKLINTEKSKGFLNWLQNAWTKIKEMIGLSSYTIEQVRNMSLQDYTNAVATDLLSGNNLFSEYDNDTNQIKFVINKNGEQIGKLFDIKISDNKLRSLLSSEKEVNINSIFDLKDLGGLENLKLKFNVNNNESDISGGLFFSEGKAISIEINYPRSFIERPINEIRNGVFSILSHETQHIYDRGIARIYGDSFTRVREEIQNNFGDVSSEIDTTVPEIGNRKLDANVGVAIGIYLSNEGEKRARQNVLEEAKIPISEYEMHEPNIPDNLVWQDINQVKSENLQKYYEIGNQFYYYTTDIYTNPSVNFQIDNRQNIKNQQEKLENKLNSFLHASSIGLNITTPKSKIEEIRNKIDSCAF